MRGPMSLGALGRRWRVPALLAIGFVGAVDLASAGIALPDDVNVLQDCWTTNESLATSLEQELYTFDEATDIDLLWKHKVLENCTSYRAYVAVQSCKDGMNETAKTPVYQRQAAFGVITALGSPDDEQILGVTLPAGTLPVGRYDWLVITECDDTNNQVSRDGDVDDTCGVNLVAKGKGHKRGLVLGPEEFDSLDHDPGDPAIGRVAGENGSTRPWCFEVTPAP